MLWQHWNLCKCWKFFLFFHFVKRCIWIHRFLQRERDKPETSTSNDSFLISKLSPSFTLHALLVSQVINPHSPSVSLSDIDECQTISPRPCHCGVPGEPCGANCVNLVPGYKCTCAPGFQLRSGGTICDGNFENNLLLICQAKENWGWLVQGVHVNQFNVEEMLTVSWVSM